MKFDQIINIVSKIFDMPVVKCVIIFIITILLDKIISGRFMRYLRKEASKHSSNTDELRLDTLFSVVRKLCTGIIYFFGVVSMLRVLLNINPASIIAATGVVGVAVGLAAQSLVKDSINGFLILFENQYSIGELVTIDDFMGTVCEITLRVTKIKNYYGDIIIIPNSTISTVINHSRADRAVIVSVAIDYSENIENVFRTLNEMCSQMKSRGINGVKSFEVWGVSALGSSGVEIKVKLVCPPGAQFELERSALKMIKETFDKEEISIPYNHIVVLTKDKIQNLN